MYKMNESIKREKTVEMIKRMLLVVQSICINGVVYIHIYIYT